MGKDKDFSVFIKSGHVLYFLLCCLFPFKKTVSDPKWFSVRFSVHVSRRM